jgi:hypothetical protein
MSLDNKTICKTLFSEISSNEYRCSMCTKSIKCVTNRGYTNLINHLKSKHVDDYINGAKEILSTQNHSIDKYIVLTVDTQNFLDWMDWILECNLPFAFLDQEITIRLSKLKKITSKTLKTNMKILQDTLRNKIMKLLPQYFGLMFDGWSDCNIHYLAVYAVVPNDDPILLLFNNFKNEENLSANSYTESWESIIDVYGLRRDSVRYLIGDNCSTNLKASRDFGIPIIGCAAHRLNLAIKMWLNVTERKILIEKITLLSKKLRTIKGKAFLKRIACKNAITPSLTRWSSVFEMVQRFIKIEPLISAARERPKELNPLMLSPLEMDNVQILFKHLNNFHSVILYLQRRNCTMADVRIIFDSLIDEYSSLRKYLDKNADIVENPNFENALVKLQNDDSDILTLAERDCVDFLKLPSITPRYEERFLIPELALKSEAQESPDFVSRVMSKKVKRTDEYQDCRFIPPTSAEVERLFSKAKNILTAKRKALCSENVEMLMFLRANRRLIDNELVGETFQ